MTPLIRLLRPSVLAAALSLAGAAEAQAQEFGLRVKTLQWETAKTVDGVMLKHIHTTNANDWRRTRTNNFDVYHQFVAPQAESFAVALERARTRGIQEWLPGKEEEPWVPVCQVYVYPNGQSYAHAHPGVTDTTPGHAKIERDTRNTSRIVGRLVGFNLGTAALRENVLPHEVWHVVSADFLELPRWADEGGSVFAETQERQKKHLDALRTLPTQYLFSLGALFRQKEYVTAKESKSPEDALKKNQALYAQGYAVFRFLRERKGMETLRTFIKDAEGKDGYEIAALRHYGLTVAQLDRAWREAEFGKKRDEGR